MYNIFPRYCAPEGNSRDLLGSRRFFPLFNSHSLGLFFFEVFVETFPSASLKISLGGRLQKTSMFKNVLIPETSPSTLVDFFPALPANVRISPVAAIVNLLSYLGVPSQHSQDLSVSPHFLWNRPFFDFSFVKYVRSRTLSCFPVKSCQNHNLPHPLKKFCSIWSSTVKCRPPAETYPYDSGASSCGHKDMFYAPFPFFCLWSRLPISPRCPAILYLLGLFPCLSATPPQPPVPQAFPSSGFFLDYALLVPGGRSSSTICSSG